jgi:hypothetical protein
MPQGNDIKAARGMWQVFEQPVSEGYTKICPCQLDCFHRGLDTHTVEEARSTSDELAYPGPYIKQRATGCEAAQDSQPTLPQRGTIGQFIEP